MQNNNLKPDKIPDVLKQKTQWVLWRSTKKKGQKKPAKVPHSPKTGRPADPTDPKNWASFAEAFAELESQPQHYTGLGFALAEDDGLVGIDLDGCRDPETGKLDQWAEDFVEDLSGLYTEVSPSGTGLHLYGFGKLPQGRHKNGRVEMYDSKRYLTVTGQSLNGNTVGEIDQATLDRLHAQYLSDDKAEENTQAAPAPLPVEDNGCKSRLSDDEVIRRASEAKNGEQFIALYNDGAGSEYFNGDPSSADMTLCNHLAFWCGKDIAQMDRIFRRSALMNEKERQKKWDSKRRDSTYGRQTMEKAIRDCKEVFGPDAKSAFTKADRKTPAGISASDLMLKEIPPMQWAIEGMIPTGLSILAGKPKVGKSWLVLQIATAVAGGEIVLDSQTTQGKVAYLALEDGHRRLQSRLKKMLPDRSAPEDLILYTDWNRLNEGGHEDLETLIKDNPDLTLIIIDTWVHVRPDAAPKNTNAYQIDSNEGKALKNLADQYDIALLLVHHFRKAIADDGDVFTQISGSTGITGAADSIMALTRTRNENDAELHVTGREVREGKHALMRDQNTMAWERVGAAEHMARTRQQQDLLDALKILGEAKPKEISEEAGSDVHYTRKTLGSLLKQGLIKKTGHGKYTRTGIDDNRIYRIKPEESTEEGILEWDFFQ